MAYESIFDRLFPKPTKEELAEARARKKEETKLRNLRRKKREQFQKGCTYEATGDMGKAILYYEKVIDGAANLRREHIHIKSLNKLLRFYRKEKNIEEEKRVIRIGLEWNKEDAKLKARLDYLESNQSTSILPTKRVVVTLQEKPKGYKYQELRENMIEKYWSKQTGGYFSSEEERRDTDDFFKFSTTFQKTYDQAEAAEAGNNYIEAARLYETLVANRFYSCKAYDRLIVIYNKAKLYDVVEEVLEEAIGQAQRKVFSQNDELKLIERWGERLTNLRERRKMQAKTEKNTEPQISPELVEMQKNFHTIESDFGKIQIIMIDNEVWFNGRDVCFAIGYTDPKRPMSDHCKDAQMIKYPTLMASGKPTIRRGKFILMKDVCRMINANGTFANEERLKQLHSLQKWLMESEKEYIKNSQGDNVSIDKL